MEQDSNHIDKQFNKRLYDAQAAPPAFVWTNIERELRSRRRKRFAFWLFAVGIAAGAASWGIYAGWEKDNAGHGVEKPVVSTTDPAQAPAQAATTPGLQANSAANIPAAASYPKGFAGAASLPSGAALARTETKPDREPEATIPEHGASDEQPSAAAEEVAAISPDAAATQPEAASGLPSAAENAAVKTAVDSIAATQEEIPFIRKRKDPHYCYDFTQNPSVWLIDAYLGPSFSRRTLEATNPSFDTYSQERIRTERKDLAFNAGIRGSLLFGRHFLIRTGLHYEQMTEVFEYADPNYVKYLVEITQTVIDNKPVTIIDTIGVDYGESYTRSYNRYGLLDVPVEAGVELRKGRFGLSLNGSLSLNVLFWKRGTVLSSAGQPVPFTPGEKNAVEILRPRTGLSAGGSAQVFFHLQPRLRIFMEPYIRQVLKPLTVAGQPVERRHRMTGIKIGMTKILD